MGTFAGALSLAQRIPGSLSCPKDTRLSLLPKGYQALSLALESLVYLGQGREPGIIVGKGESPVTGIWEILASFRQGREPGLGEGESLVSFVLRWQAPGSDSIVSRYFLAPVFSWQAGVIHPCSLAACRG
jgi:hypothetical protein